MLIFMGICAFCYKRRKWRRTRRPGLDNCSATSSQPPKADQFVGVPQQWHPNITPPKPSPPPGFGLNQQPSSTNVSIPSKHSSTNSSLGAGRPCHAPSPGIAFGLSQSTFTHDELARAANGFSSSNLLGQGGCGYVHKGGALKWENCC